MLPRGVAAVERRIDARDPNGIGIASSNALNDSRVSAVKRSRKMRCAANPIAAIALTGGLYSTSTTLGLLQGLPLPSAM